MVMEEEVLVKPLGPVQLYVGEVGGFVSVADKVNEPPSHPKFEDGPISTVHCPQTFCAKNDETIYNAITDNKRRQFFGDNMILIIEYKFTKSENVIGNK
jgi:hypothetical protein